MNRGTLHHFGASIGALLIWATASAAVPEKVRFKIGRAPV